MKNIVGTHKVIFAVGHILIITPVGTVSTLVICLDKNLERDLNKLVLPILQNLIKFLFLNFPSLLSISSEMTSADMV